MGRFASTVPFYEKSRQPYGQEFFATVAQRLGLHRGQRLLDLGTGPGLLALGFAPFVGEVCGVDPEPAMLEAARHNARSAGVTLRLIEGTAETLPADIGRFHLGTIGRALHWMEPERTRLTLDRVVEDHGVILVCSASSVGDGSNPWLDTYDAVRRAWSADSGHVRYKERDAFFAGSRFRFECSISVATERGATPDELADRALSMSSSSPAAVGGGVEAMRAEIKGALEPFAPDGTLPEVVEARAEVFRSDASP